jgi:serine beta-lactamase-like protein LACTB, mitochondrial
MKSALVVLLIAAAPLRAAEEPAARAQALLQQLARTTPAVSAAVARDGTIVFSAGAGTIDLENDVPAAGNSVYNVGSVSKAITAIAMMQLVEQKKISLTDDVRAYVPELPDKGAKITIWNVLTHTSGIRHYHRNDFPGTADNENMLPVDDWRSRLRIWTGDPLLFPPGQYFSYSSYAVNLLQGVVEKAAGQPFEAYLAGHVWTPAGAASGSVDIPDRVVLHRARSYVKASGRWNNYSYADVRYKFASGGMIASGEDLVKVAVALNHDRLLRRETRTLMLTPQLDGLLHFRENGTPEAMDFRQALLWRVNKDAEGREFVYHCGTVKGFNVCLIDYVADDLVAALMTNSDECCGWKKTLELANFFRQPR